MPVLENKSKRTFEHTVKGKTPEDDKLIAIKPGEKKNVPAEIAEKLLKLHAGELVNVSDEVKKLEAEVEAVELTEEELKAKAEAEAAKAAEEGKKGKK